MKIQNKIIIIGAARSGTNMLRDVLTQFEGVATWPCDEINYLWRHSNKKIEHDCFTPSMVNGKMKKYIEKQFSWVANKYNAKHIVEKTCANSLRVDYVNDLVADGKYIFIYRDPYDVVSSAEIRWKAELNLKYIYDKARFVPITDIPYYGSKYLFNRFSKLLNKEKRLSYWGPKYKGFEADAKTKSAIEISAIQWRKSVESSLESFKSMDQNKFLSINYNDFVMRPADIVRSILSFLEIEADDNSIRESVSKISAKSIGKGYNRLSVSEWKVVQNIVGDLYDSINKQVDVV